MPPFRREVAEGRRVRISIAARFTRSAVRLVGFAVGSLGGGSSKITFAGCAPLYNATPTTTRYFIGVAAVIASACNFPVASAGVKSPAVPVVPFASNRQCRR